MTVFRDITFLAAGPQVNAVVSSQKSCFTMAAFTELDWTRFDVWAAVAMEGVAVVEPAHREACLAWLRQHDYSVTSIDFALGVSPAVVALGEKLRWEERFGYRLAPETHNLNALRDGFDFHLKPGQGHVLELLNAEIANRECPLFKFRRFQGVIQAGRTKKWKATRDLGMCLFWGNYRCAEPLPRATKKLGKPGKQGFVVTPFQR